jgi:hypothetical protein
VSDLEWRSRLELEGTFSTSVWTWRGSRGPWCSNASGRPCVSRISAPLFGRNTGRLRSGSKTPKGRHSTDWPGIWARPRPIWFTCKLKTWTGQAGSSAFSAYRRFKSCRSGHFPAFEPLGLGGPKWDVSTVNKGERSRERSPHFCLVVLDIGSALCPTPPAILSERRHHRREFHHSRSPSAMDTISFPRINNLELLTHGRKTCGGCEEGLAYL